MNGSLRRWIQRLDRWTVGRFVLGLLGIAALIEGAIIAWRADAATPILIVGAVLAALGLFNWTQLTAQWRDWKFTLWTLAQQSADKLQEVAEREELSPEGQQELEEAAASIAAIEAVTATGPTGPTGPMGYWRTSARRVGGSNAYHRFLGDGQVVLGISGGPLNRYECIVTEPGGRAVRGKATRVTTAYLSPSEATFPNDFSDAHRPPKEGLYEVDWYSRTAVQFPGMSGAAQHVGHDEFSLPPSPADALGLT